MPVAVLDDSDERFQLGDSSEGSTAQLNPTSVPRTGVSVRHARLECDEPVDHGWTGAR